MENNIQEIYEREIKQIINSDKVEAIFLVGSSKELDIKKIQSKISDIDLFIFKDIENTQIREIKFVDGIEFDINYFSKEGINKFIEDREYFFLKEMSNPKIIYDKSGKCIDIIKLCKETLIQGPNKLSSDEKEYIKSDIYSKINALKNKVPSFEYEFLLTSYLKDMITGYFIINGNWVPKDKKLLKVVEKENIQLFNLIKQVYEYHNYEDLEKVYNYVFKDIKLSENIKIIY